MALLFALAAVAAPAWGQTDKLVSNLGQISTNTVSPVGNQPDNVVVRVAQAFRTGDNATGHTLSTVVLGIASNDWTPDDIPRISIYPVAIFLRGAKLATASLTLGTERRRYLAFDTLACKLKEIPAERWQHSDNLVARVNLPNMQSSEHRKIEIYAEAIRGLLELERDSDKRAKYIEFIDIYAAPTDNEYRRYQRQYREDSSTMAGVISRAREEGMQRGMEQGMEQGRVEGERAVLERLLRRRFGLLSPQVAERLSQASAADLESWAENVLDAPTVDDVFKSSR